MAHAFWHIRRLSSRRGPIQSASPFFLASICIFEDAMVESVDLGVVQGYGAHLPLLQMADRNNVERRRGCRRWKENQVCVGS